MRAYVQNGLVVQLVLSVHKCSTGKNNSGDCITSNLHANSVDTHDPVEPFCHHNMVIEVTECFVTDVFSLSRWDNSVCVHWLHYFVT